LKDTRKVVYKLNKALYNVPIAQISTKRSLARWELKQNYERVNGRFEKYANRHNQIDFIYVWALMSDEEGVPMKKLFIEDGLYMTKSGYNIWTGEIVKYIK
jgi:hypothetical protein